MTTRANLPPTFRTAAHRFAEELKANFSSTIQAQPEDQLKAPVMDLLASTASNVLSRTEAQLYEIGGRPDIGVTVHNALCGHVELKAPETGARTNRYSGSNKKQWEKFKALPNILYTDAIEWALYRSGVQDPVDDPVLIRFDNLIERGADALDDERLAKLHTLLIDFLSWEPIVPATAPALAEMLAPLCRLLRTDVLTAVEREESALHRLCDEIRDYLFPHVTDAQFADMYAQTLTYALLLARLSGETDLTAAHAADRLDSGHGLLAQTLRILTQPAARGEIQVPVSLLERVIGAVDPDRLRGRGDPWLYFYEDFLAAYDPKLRKNYGVYYTPQQVISCQIDLVSELLIQHFNKPLTFADEGVIFLDPGAGTAAYPLAAVESALRRVESRLGSGAIGAMATRCAENLYGFEILVGPYAVGHLRLTKMFTDAGASLPEDGIHMYLADTLESPHTDPPQPPLIADRLTTEQRRARHVKEQIQVFVSMGNPPYYREQEDERERGKWVRFGDPHVPNELPILEDFLRPASDAGAGVHLKNLFNLYVYFWRWTLWKMFENPHAAGRGIISFITASSYLRGPGFVGMRQKLREAFDDLWILDLEGDNLGARKTENVFDIQTPVCIAVGIRHAPEKRNPLAITRYSRITGTRAEKFTRLAAIRSFEDLEWRECFSGAQDAMWPVPPEAWSMSPLLTDIFPWQHSGVQWKRSWPIGETRDVLANRWTAFTGASQRAAMFKETRDRRVTKRYPPLLGNARRLVSLNSISTNEPHPPLHRYAFRSFDRRWVMLDNRLGDYLRRPLWETLSDRQVFLTSLITNVLGLGAAATACAEPPDLHHFCGRGAKDVIPLWRDAAAAEPNLPAGLLDLLIGVLGALTAEDIFAYVYAVLSAPSYVQTFWEELFIPGPRIPITRNAGLFSRASAIGRRLLWFHTYGERFVPERQQPGRIPPGNTRCVRGIPTTDEGYPDTVSWEAGVLRVGDGEFSPVAKAVWEFSVSDFLIVDNWIKSRLRDRTGRRTSPLDEIRPGTWNAEMTQELLELLWVVEATIDSQPELNAILTEILAGPLFSAEELPQPTADERRPPSADEEDDQHEMTLE
jgi:hypothetical protein